MDFREDSRKNIASEKVFKRYIPWTPALNIQNIEIRVKLTFQTKWYPFYEIFVVLAGAIDYDVFNIGENETLKELGPSVKDNCLW